MQSGFAAMSSLISIEIEVQQNKAKPEKNRYGTGLFYMSFALF